MDHKDNIHKQLQKLKDTSIFPLPEEYFEDLPLRISERVSGRETGNNGIFGWSFHRPVWSISFVMVFVIAFFLFFLPNERNSQQGSFFDNVNIEEMISANPEFIFEVSEYEIIDGLVANNEDFSEKIDINAVEIPEDDIIEFLDNSDLDLLIMNF